MDILLAAQAFDSSVLADVKFYVILTLLAAALIAIIVIFARWESFKMKKKDDSDKAKYIRPTIIKVNNEHKK